MRPFNQLGYSLPGLNPNKSRFFCRGEVVSLAQLQMVQKTFQNNLL